MKALHTSRLTPRPPYLNPSTDIYDFLTGRARYLTPHLRERPHTLDMDTDTRPTAFEAPAYRGPKRPLQPQPPSYLWKRALLGRPLHTKELEHERLGKPTALAVFASDNLSSVAYATEEILKAVVPVVGLAAFGLLMPTTIGILVVLAILVFSYRQTIKAYPSAGGAYIVTKDNLGVLPAQVAGVALLTDYVLTAAVSIAAGVAAISAAFPAVYPYRVGLSLLFVWMVAWGNLRGVREAGKIFAVPTYFFIAMMVLLIAQGLFRAASGSLHPMPAPPEVAATTGAVGLFLILHAFASGGAAVTGVEAISNGVPAFRPPAWKHARQTLVWMASLLGAMFLGLSFLAVKIHALPVEGKTVISEVGRAVFGSGILGHAQFLMLQVATTLILILAANTSFADFPRLANFQAGDKFMPRQMTTRGHRLTYSNGIIGLAVAASGLLILFQADVHHLIPLYAIGVFTSFTLSQTGMAVRHLRLRETGWRLGFAINGLGALTTGVVAVVVAITKFTHGGWAIMVLVPILVWMLVRMNRRYETEVKALDTDPAPMTLQRADRPSALIVVERIDHGTLHALQYARTIRPAATRAVHFDRAANGNEELRAAWDALGTGIPLTIVKGTSDLASSLVGYLAGLDETQDVTVILPAARGRNVIGRVRQRFENAKISRALLPDDRVRLTVVRDHSHEYDPARQASTGSPDQHAPRANHVVVVLVDRVDRASVGAVRYAASLRGTQTWGVHAAVDVENQSEIIDQWLDRFAPVPLRVIECPDRNVARALESYVAEIAGPNDEITVVLPRRDYDQTRQRLLHDRTSSRIAKRLSRYAHVNVTFVRHYLRGTTEPTPVDRLRAYGR